MLYNIYIIRNNKNNIKNKEIIVTTSTSPKRLNDVSNIIDNILNKQNLKPTKFYLNVPYKFKRTGETYPEDKINELRNKYKNLQINRCEDLGPVTKISETLRLVNNQNTIIIILDDDTDYPPDFLELLVNKLNENPDCVVANSIYDKNVSKLDIDLVEGFKGICFKRKVFKDDFFDLINVSNNYKHCFNSDDYIISRYLTSKNIKFITPGNYFNIRQFDYGLQNDALHKQDNIDHIKRYHFCKEYLDNNK